MFAGLFFGVLYWMRPVRALLKPALQAAVIWMFLCPENPTGHPEQRLETPQLATDAFAQSNFNVPEDAFPVA